MKSTYFLIALFFSSFIVQAQNKKENNATVIASLKKNINYLANDKLEGRRTGTAGEKLAYEFIQNEFRKAGLQTFTANKNYVQEFKSAEPVRLRSCTVKGSSGKPSFRA